MAGQPVRCELVNAPAHDGVHEQLPNCRHPLPEAGGPSWPGMTPRQFDTAAADQPLTLFGTDAAGNVGADLFSLDGCTCGGIGASGAHRRDCAWSM
jgi:hypothetical protein